jgi:hypothetical protein
MDYPDITTRPGAIAFILAMATETVNYLKQDEDLGMSVRQVVAGRTAVITAMNALGISMDELEMAAGVLMDTFEENGV